MNRMSFLVALVVASSNLGIRAAEPVSFRKDIAPILLGNCLACHGPKKAEGSFRVDSYERLTAAGDTGTPGIKAGNLDRFQGRLGDLSRSSWQGHFTSLGMRCHVDDLDAAGGS